MKDVLHNRARIFLLVDLRDFFSDLGSGDFSELFFFFFHFQSFLS